MFNFLYTILERVAGSVYRRDIYPVVCSLVILVMLDRFYFSTCELKVGLYAIIMLFKTIFINEHMLCIEEYIKTVGWIMLVFSIYNNFSALSLLPHFIEELSFINWQILSPRVMVVNQTLALSIS